MLMTDAETPPFDPRAMWEQRYGGDDYLYGTDPNEFLRDQVTDVAVGDVLCLADGEGRNSVFLATLGHRVTAVDLTEAGIAKADRLATDRGVEVTTVVADLADFDLGRQRWDLVVSIFAHTPPPVRLRLHQAMATALRPGGRFVLEAYTPDQIGRGTGGPPTPALTMTLEGLREELADLEIVHGIEVVRPILEGPGHTGDGAVVQVVARRNDLPLSDG
jgi:SAM-dependent methyltransferase